MLDEFGNVQGGLRSPYVDVPTSTWRGIATGASFCFIAGHEIPFDQAPLDGALPDARRVRAGGAARCRATWSRDRFLTREDGQRLIREAGGRRSLARGGARPGSPGRAPA